MARILERLASIPDTHADPGAIGYLNNITRRLFSLPAHVNIVLFARVIEQELEVREIAPFLREDYLIRTCTINTQLLSRGDKTETYLGSSRHVGLQIEIQARPRALAGCADISQHFENVAPGKPLGDAGCSSQVCRNAEIVTAPIPRGYCPRPHVFADNVLHHIIGKNMEIG